MSEMVFLLEESSARAMLEGLLPRVIPTSIRCRFIVFEGKQDLEKQLSRRLRGYLVPDALFVILRDQDSEDCQQGKSRLLQKCAVTGKAHYLVRIACRELESWYLGDLTPVEQGLGLSNLSKKQNKNPCRNPDTCASPSKYLKTIAPDYKKTEGSRAIGPCLSLLNNRSTSFRVFLQGIRSLVAKSPKRKRPE